MCTFGLTLHSCHHAQIFKMGECTFRYHRPDFSICTFKWKPAQTNSLPFPCPSCQAKQLTDQEACLLPPGEGTQHGRKGDGEKIKEGDSNRGIGVTDFRAFNTKISSSSTPISPQQGSMVPAQGVQLPSTPPSSSKPRTLDPCAPVFTPSPPARLEKKRPDVPTSLAKPNIPTMNQGSFPWTMPTRSRGAAPQRFIKPRPRGSISTDEDGIEGGMMGRDNPFANKRMIHSRGYPKPGRPWPANAGHPTAQSIDKKCDGTKDFGQGGNATTTGRKRIRSRKNGKPATKEDRKTGGYPSGNVLGVPVPVPVPFQA